MIESVDTKPFGKLTTVAFERVITTLLDEIAVAYVSGDKKFLDAIGVTAKHASIIEGTNRTKLAKRLVSKPDGTIHVGFEVQPLELILAGVQKADQRERQCRELVNAGANNDMLNELGFRLNREGLSTREGFTGMRATHPGEGLALGRVQNLTAEQMQRINIYWAKFNNPSEVDPIDHLIRSAQYLNVNVGSIWKYIMEDPNDDSIPKAPDGVQPWVMIMFPRWGEDRNPKHNGARNQPQLKLADMSKHQEGGNTYSQSLDNNKTARSGAVV